MKNIEEGLESLSGYLISVKRNTIKGWYELEIGVPSDWIYKENDLIDCEVLKKSDNGHLLKISPKKEGIIVDDLIAFVKLIIDTNSRILEKEKEFTDKMDQVKKDLENQAKKFYKELDDLREKSFSKFNIKKPTTKSITSTSEKGGEEKKVETTTTTQKRGRGRPSKKKEHEQEKTD